jgi:hypothetical protein
MIHIQSEHCCQIGFFTGAGISKKSGALTCLGSGFQTGNACRANAWQAITLGQEMTKGGKLG